MTPIASHPDVPAPLEEVVEENKQVVEEIRKAVDELTVVHAVLTVENEKVIPSEDTKKAVKRTKVVRTKLTDTASKLEAATHVLERHAGMSPQE